VPEYFDDITNNHTFTWTNGTATTGSNFTVDTGDSAYFTFTGNGIASNPIIPDKNWMPYVYVMYEPKWHKKYASYKFQIEKMWE